jgi:hypothetical protein
MGLGQGLMVRDVTGRGPPLVAVENVVLAAVSVFALALTIIAVLAWRRSRDARLLFLAAAFSVFFVKSLLLTIALFVGDSDLVTLFLVSAVFDLVILALFYGFTLRR